MNNKNMEIEEVTLVGGQKALAFKTRKEAKEFIKMTKKARKEKINKIIKQSLEEGIRNN